jgi:hypothetical protein
MYMYIMYPYMYVQQINRTLVHVLVSTENFTLVLDPGININTENLPWYWTLVLIS